MVPLVFEDGNVPEIHDFWCCLGAKMQTLRERGAGEVVKNMRIDLRQKTVQVCHIIHVRATKYF